MQSQTKSLSDCAYNEAYIQAKTCAQVSLEQHGLDLSRSTHTWIFCVCIYEVYFPYDCFLYVRKYNIGVNQLCMYVIGNTSSQQ